MNGSEVMFTKFNASSGDNETQQEFPHWRPVVSLLMLSLWILSLSVLMVSLLNSSVLLAIIKNSSFNKVLATVHVYVLVLNILVRVGMAINFSIFIPPAI